MWVRSCDGVLVNLDNCLKIYIDEPLVFAHEAGAEENPERIPLFRGTAEECGRYRDLLECELVVRGEAFAAELPPNPKEVPSVN